jgi:hypothetical protein
MKAKRCSIKITEWIPEDELTEDILYDTLFSLSKVDFIRYFPKTIKVTESNRGK